MNKILFLAVNKSTDWGGSEKLWMYTAKYLAENNGQIELAATIPKRIKYHENTMNLMKMMDVYTRVNHPIIFRRMYCKLRGISHKELEFIEIINRVKPNMVIISQGLNMDGGSYMKFCNNLNIPYITISQSVNEYNWFPYESVLEMRECFEKARLNLFVSQANLELTQKQIGAILSNAKVIRNPFDVPYDNTLTYPDDDTLKLACVARYEIASKGQDLLLEAISDSRWKDRKIQINLYGSGRDENLLKDIIKMYGINDKVFIRGYANPLDIWRENHALVLTSRFEGLPLALVEAMLCGRIPIVTNVSGNAELIIDGNTGFIAKGANKVEINYALERTWQNRVTLKKMGETAKASVKQQVSSNPILDLVSIINDAVN